MHCELAQLADGAEGGSAVLAELDGAIPLFWVTLASADDVVMGDGPITIAMAPETAIVRSGERLDALVAAHPGAYDGLVRQWRDLLAGLGDGQLSVSITGAKRNLGRELTGLLASFPDPSTEAYAALAKTCGWPDGLPGDADAGDDPAVAERLCGRPRFRPVPWTVPAANVRPANADRPGRRLWVTRARLTTGRDSRFPVLGSAGAVDAAPARTAPPSPFTPGWLVTGPALMGVLVASWLSVPEAALRPAGDARVWALVALVAMAGCVRRKWPFPALVVIAAGSATYAQVLDLDLGPMVAVLFFALITVVRWAPWPQAVLGAAVAWVVLATIWSHASVAEPTPVLIGWSAAWVAATAAFGGALRFGRHLRARRRLARDRGHAHGGAGGRVEGWLSTSRP